jgi:ribosomal-protein-alanine N-acetyltransferase
VPSLLSERLELASITLGYLEAMVRGDLEAGRGELGVDLPAELAGRTHLLQMRLTQIQADPAVEPWLIRLMIPRQGTRQAIGHIGFHGPPDAEGRVEVGYTVFAPHRGQGFATEASRALFAWATAEHGVTRFRASVSPTNAPSLAVVRKLGFRRTGVQWDEIDGEELVFELDL